MEPISKTILLEEDWIQLHIWHIQDCRKFEKRKKRKIRKLLFTLQNLCTFKPNVKNVATQQQPTFTN